MNSLVMNKMLEVINKHFRNMIRITFIGLVFIIISCKNEIGDNIIYQDLLSQLIVQNNIMPLLAPPKPYFVDKSDNVEMSKLKEKVFFLEDRMNRINQFISKEHKVYILDKLLPFDSKYFKNPYIGTSETIYDKKWIGDFKSEISNHRNLSIKSLNFKISFYKTEFIESIPKPDTTIYSSTKGALSEKLYIQLSEIIFNKSKNKGIFYYALSDNGNINGYMKFAYIEKIKNDWVIIKKD